IRDATVTGVQTCALPIYAHGRARVGGERGQPVEETAAQLLIGREGEELLELVDDEQQLAVGRQDPLRHTPDAELVAGELLDQVRSEERRVGKGGGVGWRT